MYLMIVRTLNDEHLHKIHSVRFNMSHTYNIEVRMISHIVIFCVHLDKQEWEDFCNKHIADAGVCPACAKVIKGHLGK